MAEISTSNLGLEKSIVQPNGNVRQNTTSRPSVRKEISYDEFWRREKRKNNGLIERLYNKIKNLTGLGVGSKKVEAAILQAKNKQVSADELRKTVHDYHSSQENSAQLLGDAASIGASAFTFFGLNKLFKYVNAGTKVNQPIMDFITDKIQEAKTEIEEIENPAEKKLSRKMMTMAEGAIKWISSNKRLTVVAVGLAAYMGGLAKYGTLKLNRTGSDEFKLDKQIYGKKSERNKEQKLQAKEAKRKLKKERRKTNFKNFASGAINGLMMPVMALGGIIGAPLYLVGNSLNRYFVANKTDKNKSVNGYINNLTNDGLTIGLATAAAAIPLVKKGNYTKIFNENIAKVADRLAKAELKEAEYGGNSAYQKLEKELLSSSSIKSIIEDSSISIDQKVQRLIEENIFAAKFKQIADDGSLLCKALKENCPETRTLEQAQEYINKYLGSGYKVTNLLGVGTVAETYFAKSPEGKEVCIKILKDGISKEKILKDKEKFVEVVKNMKDKSQDEIDYLLRNVDDLSEGILKEADLKNEMEAAKELAQVTHVANVVKPIKVVNNVYVMERANGVSLESFMKLNKLYIAKEEAAKLGGKKGKEDIAAINKQIEQTVKRMPGFDNIELRKEDVDYILGEYQKVFIEQFHKIDKNGKIMHGDLHPGNIFIDPKVLRSRKGKLFTLIDTGNTISISKEQSLHALNFTKYVHQGNVKDIAAFVLDGAKLPSGMSKEDALEKITAELRKCFFDDKTKIGQLNDEAVLTLTDNIMQKLDIIPNSTQLNLYKSRTSARNSLSELKKALFELNLIDVVSAFENEGKGKGALVTLEKISGKLAKNQKYNSMIRAQEKLNLRQLTAAEKLKQKKNPNAPKTNSEDYLTYRIKQYVYDLEDIK